MTFAELVHVLRAAAVIANETTLVVVGSQAVSLREKMIEIGTLRERINMLDSAQHPVASVLAWANRRALEAHT